MSAVDGQADQVLELTLEEVQVLGGAFNVICELLARPDIEVPPGIPVSRDRKPLFDQIELRLEARIERLTPGAETSISFDPAEAQAVRDVAGGLEVLLADPIGRERLAQIGFLVSPTQDVDEAEIDLLKDIIRRIDPTGVREPVEREPEEIIDPTLPLTTVIAQAREEIRDDTIPWPGFEQGEIILDDIADAFGGGRTNLSCDGIFRAMVEATKLAVAGHRAGPGEGPGRGFLAGRIENALFGTLSAIEANNCVPDAMEERLAAALDEVADAVDAGVDPGTGATQLLETIKEATGDGDGLIETAEGVPPAVGGPLPDKPTDNRRRDEQLRRIDQLLDELEVVTEQTLDDPLDEDDVRVNLAASLPSRRDDCDAMLVTLAEFAQIGAQMVASSGDPADPDLPDQALVRPLNDARRSVIAGLSDNDCLPTETIRELRNSILSVHDPLPADPPDVQARAFAAISDVRDAFRDPRRGAGIAT